MIAYLLSFIDRQILSLLIEPIRSDLGISDTQFGLLNGLAFSLFYATMGIPIAALSDRTSRPRIICAGIVIWSMATMLSGLARSFPQLFFARICVGAEEAALSPAAYSLIGDLFPREQLGRAVAVYSLGSFLGAGVAFLVGGWVIAATTQAGAVTIVGILVQPWQLTMMMVGAPGLLLALVIALACKEPRRSTATVRAEGLGGALHHLKKQRRIFLPHMFGFAITATSLYGLLGWSPAYLMRTFDFTPGQAGLWLGLIAIVAGGGGNLASGLFMDRLLRRGHADAPFLTGMIGAAGIIAPIALLPLATAAVPAACLLAAGLFFASFPMAPSTAVVQIVTPPQLRARVAAIFLCLNAILGLAVGSALIGFINDRALAGRGTGIAMASVVVVAALSSVLLLAFGRAPYARATRTTK